MGTVSNNSVDSPALSFSSKFNGKFIGLRKWEDFDAVVELLLRDPQGWYVYMIGKPVPTHTAPDKEFHEFLDELNGLLREDHDYDYCGIVYVDDASNPAMIKIYDPNNLGTSCGSGGERILPGWVISRLQPESLGLSGPVPGGRARWWQRFFPALQS